MINCVTVGIVAHTKANLIKNKGINICVIFMYFFIWKKYINMAYFFVPKDKL